MNQLTTCPVCSCQDIVDFYQKKHIPVQSVVLLHSRDDALNFPKGDLLLSYCKNCLFVFNRAYQPDLVDYRLENESTQRYSGTFNSFEKRLAEDLIQKYSLQGKSIIEIGCGQGEFLELLCSGGKNQCLGFDPAYDPKQRQKINDQIEIIPDYYSRKYQNISADFFCCKMTLEHIHQPVPLLQTIHKTIATTQHPAKIFFQIPDTSRIFSEYAFWDLYYEHCSYYSPGSLSTLFLNQSFEILEVWKDYGDQYLMISAQAPASHHQQPINGESQSFLHSIEKFQHNITQSLTNWKQFFDNHKTKKIVIWGAGSKCVSFCTTLELSNEISCAVDINPQKAYTFLPGSGHPVITPDHLREVNPHIVIMMNPIYEVEIRNTCTQMGLYPQFIKITDINHEMPNL